MFPVTRILSKLGINVTVVKEQTTKDTEFSTVAVPNPNSRRRSRWASRSPIDQGGRRVRNRPRFRRLGVAVEDDQGEFVALSGDQVGILLLDYILTRLKEENALPANAAVVKSFVTTGMAKAICADFGVALFETPVGFNSSAKRARKGNGRFFAHVRVRL